LKSSLTVERRTSLPSLTPLNNNNCRKKNPICFLSFVVLIIFLSWVMNFSPQKKRIQKMASWLCLGRIPNSPFNKKEKKRSARKERWLFCWRERLSLLILGSFHFWPAWGIAILRSASIFEPG
jgi:hypothetical protein